MDFRCLFLFLITIHYSFSFKNTTPVFLLDYEGLFQNLEIEPDPFHMMLSSHFTDIVHSVIRKSDVIILFTENNFSTEDVSLKDVKGTPFQHLQKGLVEKKVRYMPSVQDPYTHLTRIFQPHHYNIFHLGETQRRLKLGDNHYKYFYVFFQDGFRENRVDVLRRHDELMKEAYFEVRAAIRGVITAFYTGKSNPMKQKLQFQTTTKAPQPVEKNPSVMVYTDGALFRFRGMTSNSPLRSQSLRLMQVPDITEQTWTPQKLSTRMSYSEFELEFDFSFRKDGWSLDHVALLEDGEEVGKTKMGVGAPWGCSFVCGDPLILANSRDGSTISIKHYQIQPFKTALRQEEEEPEPESSSTPDIPLQEASAPASSGIRVNSFLFTVTPPNKRTFGPSVDCGPYFKASIFASFFVVSICLGILTFGITMLMNCHTNDRYDDAHGKQLMIPSSGGG